MSGEAANICLVRTSAVGDVVHALALVNGLKDAWPGSRITWILHPVPYEVVRHQPAVDRFVVFPRRGLDAWRELRRQLAGERFDLAIVPQVSLKASLVAAHVKAPVKVGFDLARSRELHWFFTNRHIPPRPAQHVQDHYFEFLDYLGAARPEPRWDLTFTEAELDRRRAFARRAGSPILALVVASSSPAKDWTPEGYAAVADAAAERFGLVPMLVGGPSTRERALARAITQSCSVKPIQALDVPIRETMVKLSAARVVVAPDTGPLHVAVALGVPTVGLYGLSDPRRCGPYRRYADLLVDHFTDDSDPEAITRRRKKGRMATIAADEVIARIERALVRYQTPLSL